MSRWQPVDSQAERLGDGRVALSDHAARADLIRIKRGLLLGGVVTVLAAQLVGRRMLRLVTWLAVGAGKWIGGRISEKLLYRLAGGMFLMFGLFSLKQALG
jgi:putative Ca2+/H+ antiporter (TMEM165/GDT1 family)